MAVEVVRDRDRIFDFLQTSPEINVYTIGDLDDFFWPHTIWYALTEGATIQAMALLYTGMEPPTLLSFCHGDLGYTRELLAELKSTLPKKFNAHLSAGLADAIGREHIASNYGHNYKMALRNFKEAPLDEHVRALLPADLAAIEVFYKEAYPGNWFDKRMLETRKYYGYFIDEKLAGVAGIHVYSATYAVAALGNIATHPAYRGRQVAYYVTNALCLDLTRDTRYIGLNVKADNDHAIRCYRKVGFEIVGTYEECQFFFR